MNKPIRTIAIFCLLLFVALMINATWLQYWKSDSYDKDPRNRRVIEAAYSRERGAILVGREPVAESVESDDEYDFLRTYSEPFKYAHVTGYFSFYDQTGIERSQNDVLSGDDDLLFVNKLVDLLSNKSGKGGNVQLTLDRDAQDAAYEGLDNLPGDVEASVVAIQPSTGKILAMASLPSFDPNKLATHDFAAVKSDYERLQADESEPLLNRAIQTTLPPGSTFKLVTAAAAMESGLYDADSEVPGGASYQLPQTSDDSGLIDNEGRNCGSDKIPFEQAMAQSCNTTFAQLGVELGGDALLEQAEAFGFNQRYLTTSGRRRSPTSLRTLTEPEAGQSAIGQFEVQASPAADGDGGRRDRQPGRRDEALHRRLDPVARARDAQADRARRAGQRGVGGDRGRAHPADDRDGGGHQQRGRGTAGPARSMASRWPARPAPPRAARPTCRRTPGSCRSPRPRTPRSPWR